jgi:hypothetical protein
MSDITKQVILDRYKWHKVQAPRTWAPKEVGDELVGFYHGQSVRLGSFGQYTIVIVHVPLEGAFMVSGIKVVQLVDSAMIKPGWPMRIRWLGYRKLAGDREMKDFEVFVAEGEPIAEEDLPDVRIPAIRVAQ